MTQAARAALTRLLTLVTSLAIVPTAPAQKRTWRIKAYVMKNNVDTLLKRVKHDFPQS